MEDDKDVTNNIHVIQHINWNTFSVSKYEQKNQKTPPQPSAAVCFIFPVALLDNDSALLNRKR